MQFQNIASNLGIGICVEFGSALLVPEERIRALCFEDKCGNYGKNYMCPPYAGSLEEIRIKLGDFRRGLLLQYSKEIDVKGNKKGVIQTRLDFHNKILRMEELLREKGISRIWSMIGGTCGLCGVCKAIGNEPCPYPDKARTSLEAIAIDVLELLDRLGLDSKFHANKIVWTGCLLL
jgi:predicted metal-binding protein